MKFFLALGFLAVAGISSASAAIVQYNTAGTTFSCAAASCVVTNSPTTPLITFTSGTDTATFTYNGPGPGPGNVLVTSPTNINYGFFTFTCTVCAAGDTLAIPSFTVNLVLNDVTDAGSRTFTGVSAAGNVTASQSTLSVVWSPTSATFGPSIFSIESATPIPTDNTLIGQVTVRGFVTSSAPEPGSMFLMGAGLIGVGFTARKKFAGRS